MRQFVHSSKEDVDTAEFRKGGMVTLKQRIITGIIGGAIFLTLLIIGGYPFTFFIIALATIAMYELLRMKKIPLFSFFGILSVFLMWLLLVPNDWFNVPFLSQFTKVELFALIILILLMITVISKNKFTFDEVGFVILSSVYVGFGFHFLIATRLISDIGLALVFFVIITIWSTDSGAYFVGRKFGKRKLWPDISPKKTIEGSIGGILTAFIIGIILQLIFNIFTSTLILLAVILVVSIFGQIGDLVESALKRHYAVKDSGKLLPGHGGILDCFDSLIYVFPLLHLLQLI